MADSTVWVEMTFDSAHYLPQYEGPCKQLHGHTYKVAVGVRGRVDPLTGMVLDMAVLKNKLRNVVTPLDHRCLNDILHLPTAENIALYILQGLGLDQYLKVIVRVYETPTSWVTVSK